MGKLYRTTEADGHWHIFYIAEGVSELTTSVDNNHTHPVTIAPNPDGSMAIILTPMSAHTHEVFPLTEEDALPEKPPKRNEKELADEAIALFKEACAIEHDSREKGKESVRFVKGDQWNREDINHLKAKKRATQVLNYTQSKIDVLSGLARQNRLDPRAFPVEGSDEGLADIVTAVLIRIGKQNNLITEEIQIFEDEIIPGRGLFHLGMTQERNPLGDILIERFPWQDGYFGAHTKLDASDATHCHKAKWLSFGEAKVTYPDQYKKIEEHLMSASSTNISDPIKLVTDKGSATMAAIEGYSSDVEIVDKLHKRIRIIEHEIKEFREALWIMSSDGSFSMEVDKQVYAKAKNIPGLQRMSFPRSRIRVTVTIGGEFIRDFYPVRPYEGFSLIPVYAYKFDDGDFFGKVESMKDPQRELNKRSSQSIDLVNRILGRGWFYDNDTFDDPKHKNKFINESGGSGWHAKIADTTRPPIPAEMPPFPVELFTMHTMNLSILDGVTNISPAMHGQSKTGYESGSARMQEARGSLMGNERIFDNFSLSKQVMFRKVFKLVQKFYTPERIARIVLAEASDPHRTSPLHIAGQEIPAQRTPDQDQVIMQNILRLLSTRDLSEYDIQIGEQNFSVTAKEAQFSMWLEAARNGLPVPPELLMELSSLPNKSKYLRIMQENQARIQEMEEKKLAADLAKAGRMPV